MSVVSTIEWTDATWNVIRGCSRVSQGCVNCYAERIAGRFSGPGQPFAGVATRDPYRWNNKIEFVEAKLHEPMKWLKPRRIFMNSMSDPFHKLVRRRDRARMFAVVALTPHHTWQVLTKRPDELADWVLSEPWDEVAAEIGPIAKVFYGEKGRFDKAEGAIARAIHDATRTPWPNVWWGFSAENQETFDERWAQMSRLCSTGLNLWCSAEPLLGRIVIPIDALRNNETDRKRPRLHCVVAGGESGHAARHCDPEWVRALQLACYLYGVRFFFKQWGAWFPSSHTDDPIARLAEWGKRPTIYLEGEVLLKNWSPTDHGMDDRARLDGRIYDQGPFEDDGLWKDIVKRPIQQPLV